MIDLVFFDIYNIFGFFINNLKIRVKFIEILTEFF